jgi:hypothetical protein
MEILIFSIGRWRTNRDAGVKGHDEKSIISSASFGAAAFRKTFLSAFLPPHLHPSSLPLAI